MIRRHPQLSPAAAAKRFFREYSHCERLSGPTITVDRDGSSEVEPAGDCSSIISHGANDYADNANSELGG